jgi:membrane associated rhomboid family serine protease
MFLHGGFWHIAFNMYVLFIFGPRVEIRLGSRQFILMYVVAGLTGALLYLPFNWGSPIPMIGASGAIFGVMLAFAYYWPREKIFLFMVLPMEVRTYVVGLTAVSLFLQFSSGGGTVAHLAHLGGFLGAFLYLQWLRYRSPARRFKQQASARIVPKGHGGNHSDVERWSRIRARDLHEVNRVEVERLLEKVRQHGASSLSQSERDCLDRFTPQLH